MIKKSGLMAWLLSFAFAVVSMVWMADRAIATPLFQPSILLAQVEVDSSRSTDPTESSPASDASKTEADETTEVDSSPQTPKPSQSPEATEDTEPASGGPYDVKAIEEFYKSLYGS